LYHLSIVINGKYRMDKRAVITQEPYKLTAGEELMSVPINKQLTIGEMISNTQERMGDKYGQYDPITNNCQVWIDNLLTANGLNNDSLKNFVMQDIQELFKEVPEFTKKFSNVVSGKIAPFFDRIMYGEAMPLSKMTARQRLKIRLQDSGDNHIKVKVQKAKKSKKSKELSLVEQIANNMIMNQ